MSGVPSFDKLQDLVVAERSGIIIPDVIIQDVGSDLIVLCNLSWPSDTVVEMKGSMHNAVIRCQGSAQTMAMLVFVVVTPTCWACIYDRGKSTMWAYRPTLRVGGVDSRSRVSIG